VLLLKESQRDSTADLKKLEMLSFPQEARVTLVKLSIDSAVSLLLNLGGSTTRKEHAVFR
jgi:hypothetical protein